MPSGRLRQIYRLLQLECTRIKLIIGSFFFDQLFVGTPLDDPAVVQNHDDVRVPDRGQAVGNHERGAAFHQSIHTFLNDTLRTGIDGGGCLIEDHTRRVCRHAFVVGGVQASIADIFQHGSGEQIGILKNKTDGAAKIILADLVDIDPVVSDLAVSNVVETVQQVGDGRLACAGRADERQLLARFGIQLNIVQDNFFGT